MAISNQERVGKAMELLRIGLAPFVEREFKSQHPAGAAEAAGRYFGDERTAGKKPVAEWDAAALLKVLWEAWNDVFRRTLGPAERSLVSELRDARNRWAHQEHFSSDDAYRALDSAARLLVAVSAPEGQEIEKMKMELLRLRFDEQVRSERRKGGETGIVTAAAARLEPWREVVTPHPDVTSGRYQQAEFAADLYQVYRGEGSDEYRLPAEFFRRTYLTESLRRLLVSALDRLSGKGGDPVVQLQTNFGGGKTHSMLALFHLFSGTDPRELLGIDSVLAEAGTKGIPRAKRVVLVGNRISPGNPDKKPDGTVVRTLWGELAWQLGGKKAFARIAADDEKATSPGHVLGELFKEYGPCLVLIDEWVAYARQLHEESDLPAGSFETQFTFAQVLTESAKAAKNCLLVISLPASDTAVSPSTRAEDAEVGGVRGREALNRLSNVVARLESSWRPASAEESFEIVRRRLFEPISDPARFKHRDVTARAFAELYRKQGPDFPPESREADYEKRIQHAYPIHPEVFDRLYTDWSALLKFQRTRGVLRLMAVVIHSLWEKEDKNPLILPCTIPIGDSRVRSELLRCLSDNWAPVIDKDVEGPESLPLRLDGEDRRLGQFSAHRRVARTIYLGSAPTAAAANLGLEIRRVRLGSVMPGETPGHFDDALRHLAASATYLYQDQARYWYSTQPTVTKMAEDRAEQLKRDPDEVVGEIENRVRKDARKLGEFSRVHALPSSGQDVPDDMEVKLVVLGPDHPHTKDSGSLGLEMAQTILASRGSSPRICQNTLAFLAADTARLQDLDEAVRRFLAWKGILDDKDGLNLTPHQVTQAQTQLESADETVGTRLPEAYKWLLVPAQRSPQTGQEWEAIPLTGEGPLAERASKKLRKDEALLTQMAGTRLRLELDRIPLWEPPLRNHVSVRQLAEEFARYIYLPRLRDPSVLTKAVEDGLGLLSWNDETFALADSFDERSGRYVGLRCGQAIAVPDPQSTALLVKPSVAAAQSQADAASALESSGGGTARPVRPAPSRPGDRVQPPPSSSDLPPPPRRYHGTVSLEPTRVGRDAGRIADEVISHLVGLVGADVTVTLEIHADIPSGAPGHVVRTVTENSRALKFTSQGFEAE
ncbi:MAG: ATP-binding protein [Planctomycetes bacterium]|nr:ATP-binding protein [Planctomycetota bacterium]